MLAYGERQLTLLESLGDSNRGRESANAEAASKDDESEPEKDGRVGQDWPWAR